MRRRPHGRRRHHPRLFWRIYGYGILLLVAIAMAAAAIAHVLDLGAPWRETVTHLARTLAAQPAAAAGPGLADRVTLLGAALRSDIAVYGADDAPLATTEAAPAPLAAADRAALREDGLLQREGVSYVAVPPGAAGATAAAPAYVAVRWWPGFRRGHSLAWFLLVALLVSAAVMLPLARSLARPLERLAAAARALGGGDLDARTGVRRRDEIGVAAAAFDEMADRVKALVRSERELLANVSHELRTPLARLAVALELCEEESDAAALRAQAAAMTGDVEELNELVETVLTAARFDLARGSGADAAAGFAPRRAPLDLPGLVAEAAARFAERHPDHALATAVDPDLPPVAGDAALLRRVIDNLLENAARHGRGPDGRATVELAVRAAADAVTLAVADRGPGVPPADLPRLFEPFFQTDRSRSGARRGLGLGLTLCRRIVAAHGGTVTAALREGGGLVVRVTLPRFTELHTGATSG